jgi:phosphohistidine phosphatase SixA
MKFLVVVTPVPLSSDGKISASNIAQLTSMCDWLHIFADERALVLSSNSKEAQASADLINDFLSSDGTVIPVETYNVLCPNCNLDCDTDLILELIKAKSDEAAFLILVSDQPLADKLPDAYFKKQFPSASQPQHQDCEPGQAVVIDLELERMDIRGNSN